jgi:hypothetical protein
MTWFLSVDGDGDGDEDRRTGSRAGLPCSRPLELFVR